MPVGATFTLKGYDVEEHTSSGTSSGRGLAFYKYSAEEMKKAKDAREPEKEFYYTGNVGSVTGQSGHGVDQYKEIAKAIM
eukprot:00498.XXX_979_1293_1 [CDS] Oithona nana genome sequencing.